MKNAITTSIGRLIRVVREVHGGFIKAADGTLIYFDLSAVADGTDVSRLRANTRLRYRAMGSGIPKAIWVSCEAA